MAGKVLELLKLQYPEVSEEVLIKRVQVALLNIKDHEECL